MDVRPIRSDADYTAALADIEQYFEHEPGRGFADRLAVYGVRQHSRLAVALHHLQAVRAEIGDQEVAIARERHSVGKANSFVRSDSGNSSRRC